MRIVVNGTARDVDVHPDETAVELVRDRLGLTGSKEVCGAGTCGACTMLVDGVAVAACLYPATSLEGRSVTTVEGLGSTLHPVQRAFMAEDALQCGFCTPGFVVQAAAFHDAWRKEHGKEEPTRTEVAAALAGHLCRCGAYPGIYSAVQKACKGEFDHEDPPYPRKDAREKVTGHATYTADVRLDGQLEGVILRSPHAHARVLKVSTDKARNLSGVKGVVNLMAGATRVRYVGQEIAGVAAIDRRTAEAACRLIEVEYEVLPASIGMEAAREKDAPLVYHWYSLHKASQSEFPVPPELWDGNVRGPFRLMSRHRRAARQEIEDARSAEEPGLVEETWTVSAQTHTAFEPHACVAQWHPPRRLTVHLSTQACAAMARDIADRFGLETKEVQVLCPYVGGGFGAKAELTMEAVAAIELARETRAPVRVALNRAEELSVGGFRPGAEIQVGLAPRRDGAPQALSMVAHNDGGVAIGGAVSSLCRLIYPGLDKELVDYDVATHGPPGKPFRGPGGPPAFWALEQAIDELAARKGEDPIAMRRQVDPEPLRHVLYDWIESQPAWQNRSTSQTRDGHIRRGVGVAAATWPYFVQPNSTVQVTAGPDGISVSTACQDIGTGSRTVLAHAVAEVLGLEPKGIDVHLGDSHLAYGPVSNGSRTTASIRPAAQEATALVRDALLVFATQEMGLRDVRAVPGGLRHTGGPLTWPEVLARVPYDRPFSATGQRPKDQGGYILPFSIRELRMGKGFPGSVHLAEVEVDVRLGKIRATKVWGGYAVGTLAAPELAHSQAKGGIVQGVGYALYEERVHDPNTGTILSAGMDDYRITGLGDAPEVELHFAPGGFDHVPGGGVGLGELSTLGVSASIGNAVFHATGFRPLDLPIRPDRVLAGLETK